ncbi:MAG: major capsid protein [Azoarcus sp.]|nr:major capsid protein [Azoarcus sp.]
MDIIYSTYVLILVVRELPGPAQFFLNSVFREEQREASEEIHFDVYTRKRRIAPFVAPIVAGQVVESRGYRTDTFKPAYIKDKRQFESSRPFKRAIGERIGGDLGLPQRLGMLLARDLQDQLDMLNRRLEVMAIEALMLGQITVTGDQYPTTVVNFGRHADLTATLTAGSRWGEAGVEPLYDLEDWSMRIALHSGASANTVVMDLKAWQVFSASAKVQKLLDRFRGSDRLNATVTGEGGRYMGRVGDFDIWVHNGWYEDPETGNDTPYLADYSVIMTGSDLEGVRCFGAIQDEEAGLQALPYFSKSWLEKDPAVRYLMMQSAPLPVPYRVNASFSARVR